MDKQTDPDLHGEKLAVEENGARSSPPLAMHTRTRSSLPLGISDGTLGSRAPTSFQLAISDDSFHRTSSDSGVKRVPSSLNDFAAIGTITTDLSDSIINRRPTRPVWGNSGSKDDLDPEFPTTAEGLRDWTYKQVYNRRNEYLQPVQLKIFCGTWNVCGSRPTDELSDWLISGGEYSLYTIGLQEVQPLSGISAMATDANRGRGWTSHVEKTLQSIGDFVCICARQMVGILLLVFIRRELEIYVKDVIVTEVGTGFIYTGGNKGAVAVRFQLYESTFCFMTCHLAAQQNNVWRRNQDFSEAMRRMRFSSDVKYAGFLEPLTSQVNTTYTVLDHDAVVCLGDFNYRIDWGREELMDAIGRQDWKAMKKFDQLSIVRSEQNNVYRGFKEAEITFGPTYKTAKYEEGYEVDESGLPKRPPAWTDRILWRLGARGDNDKSRFSASPVEIHCREYQRRETFGSDHKPVVATFDLVVRKLCEDVKNRVLSDVRKSLLPSVDVYPESVTTDPVRYGRIAEAYVVLKNSGVVPVDFEVDEDSVDEWLVATPMSGHIKPGAVREVCLTIRADASSVLCTDAKYRCASPYAEVFPLEGSVKITLKKSTTVKVSVKSSFLSSKLLGTSLEEMMRELPSESEGIPRPIVWLCAALRERISGQLTESELSSAKLAEILCNVDRLSEVDASASQLGMALVQIIFWLTDALVGPDLYEKVRTLESDFPASLARELPKLNRAVLREVFNTFDFAFTGDKNAFRVLANAAFEVPAKDAEEAIQEPVLVDESVVEVLHSLSSHSSQGDIHDPRSGSKNTSPGSDRLPSS